MTARLRAESIVKRYTGGDILSSASLTLEGGALTVLAGRNGTGKTTLLRICAGYIAPTSGAVVFDGETLLGTGPHRLALRGMYFLPEYGSLSSAFTLRGHADAIVGRFGGEASDIQHAAERMGVADLLDRKPTAFSGGEKRRAELALAMLRRPRCLLADEPLRGIDPRDVEWLLGGMRELADAGCAVLITGHELPAILPAVDRTVLLAGGIIQELVASDRPGTAATAGRRRGAGGAVRLPATPATVMAAAAPASTDAEAPAHRRTAAVAPGVIEPASHGRPAAEMPGEPPSTPPEPSGPFHLDEATIRDLEIFRARDGSGGVFELLDRTRTAGGRVRLRLRFRQPMTDVGEIAEVQAAVRFLLDRPGLMARLPDDAAIKEVERYVTSPFVTAARPPAVPPWMHSAWYAVWHGDLYGLARAGIAATNRFLQAVHAAADGARWQDAPGLVARPATEILALIESHAFRQLLGGAGGGVRVDRVLDLDHVVRTRLRAELERIIVLVHELDALRSMAEATRDLGLVLPEFRQASGVHVHIVGHRHPFLPDGVPNHLELTGGRNILFLTGPNMAGKTTYIRSAALCVYLAHLGLGVPARRMELTPFDGVVTGIDIVDTVRLGHSYFLGEVRRVKTVAKQIWRGRRVFAVFDELFKGTNVLDAHDAARAVLAGFARARNGAVVVSSHLAELAGDLEGMDAVSLRCFDADMRDGEPRFDHRIRPGASAQRLGMLLLERERVLDLLAPPPSPPGSGGDGDGARPLSGPR